MITYIAGHPRSGTTLLTKVCNTHPGIHLATEWGVLFNLGQDRSHYARPLVDRLWRTTGRHMLRLQPRKSLSPKPFQKSSGLLRYVARLYLQPQQIVDASLVVRTLKQTLPPVQVVGDKMPDYVFDLDHLALSNQLGGIVIYRDGRDVASSTLVKARTKWKDMPWVTHMDTAEKIASRWVAAIESMERHASHVHCIRYEDLVRDPAPVLAALGDWLDVDPKGFSAERAHTDSIGKYRSGLTDSEVAAVTEIAGPTLSRLGYD